MVLFQGVTFQELLIKGFCEHSKAWFSHFRCGRDVNDHETRIGPFERGGSKKFGRVRRGENFFAVYLN